MPTVNQIAAILPENAAIVLFQGWEVIDYDRRSGFDVRIYGPCLVTGICAGAAPGSYNVDIRQA